MGISAHLPVMELDNDYILANIFCQYDTGPNALQTSYHSARLYLLLRRDRTRPISESTELSYANYY